MSEGIVRVPIVVRGAELVRVLAAGTRLDLDAPCGVAPTRTWRAVLGRDLALVDVELPGTTSVLARPLVPIVDRTAEPDPDAEA